MNRHSAIVSLFCTFFITYPNVMWIPWNLASLDGEDVVLFWTTFLFRCVFFFALFYCQIRLNVRLLYAKGFAWRFGKNLLFTLVAGIVFVAVSFLIPEFRIQSSTVGKHLTFQFLVVSLLCSFIGYIYEQGIERNRREREMEQLKMENLESRYKALANQINPHFFFNSLNGIASLVQRGDEQRTLDYISRLSHIFRYILKSDGNQITILNDEIRFVESFADVMETRFGGKLLFKIDIPKKYLSYRLPVLSILPLLENVSAHNRIDSSHHVTVMIEVSNEHVTVTNNISPKPIAPDTNGTGLENLNKRFMLLVGQGISIESESGVFRVSLPLIAHA